MIFEREDCIDLAKNKKAIQSSISKWSHRDDASRACKTDLIFDDYAFHTGLEMNPWWMIDLESIEAIDCIRITNRANTKYQERIKSIKVELSLDGNTWIKIDPNMFEWNKLETLDVNIYQAASARWVKISLQEKNYLHFMKCEIFVRKMKGYIISVKPDGFGMRLESLMIAMLLSKKTNHKMKFIWPNGLDMDYANIQSNSGSLTGVNFLSVENIFSTNFINTFLLRKEIKEVNPYHSKINLMKSFHEIDNLPSEFKFGWTSGQSLPSSYIKDYSYTQCLKEISNCFKEIEWSKDFSDIIQYIEKQSKKIDNFTAIHLRGGELIFSEVKLMPQLWSNDRHFPYEVAIDIIMKELCNNHVVIFGQDQEANLLLSKYIQLHSKSKYYCRTVDDFIDNNISINGLKRDFFELFFMSKSKTIITVNRSAFGRVACLISGKSIRRSYQELYTTLEIYSLIQKNIFILNLNRLQISYSYYRLYELSKVLNLSYEISLSHIQKALDYDPTNTMWNILIIDCYFKMKNYNQIEHELNSIILKDKENFFKALFLGRRYNWARGIYNNLDYPYISFKDKCDYPYISFVAAKISSFKKDIVNATVFIKYALESQPNNKDFLELAQELNIDLKKNDIIEAKNQKENGYENSVQLDEVLVTANSAKVRIQNHLAYKLGSALENLKGVSGYIKITFILFDIRNKHMLKCKKYNEKIKEDPSLILPPLECSPDFQEALREKEKISYKLGEALIAICRDRHGIWWRYIKFLFKDMPKLKRDFSKNKGE